MLQRMLAGAGLLAALACSHAADIRVRNDSGIEFRDVVVGDKRYGTIAAGDTTGYQTWKKAFSTSFVSLSADARTLALHPPDYVGEPALGDGRFTYVLSLRHGALELRLEREGR